MFDKCKVGFSLFLTIIHYFINKRDIFFRKYTYTCTHTYTIHLCCMNIFEIKVSLNYDY